MTTVTVKLLDDPHFARCQCPVCGHADQHAPTCALEGLDHVYRDKMCSLVDWRATFIKNKITINRNPTADRRRR